MRSPSTGRAAGRFDLVVARDGAASAWFGLEVQAVYFSGDGMDAIVRSVPVAQNLEFNSLGHFRVLRCWRAEILASRFMDCSSGCAYAVSFRCMGIGVRAGVFMAAHSRRRQPSPAGAPG